MKRKVPVWILEEIFVVKYKPLGLKSFLIVNILRNK